jgi:hypothetical protein
VGTVKTLSFPVVLLAAISLSSLAQFPGEPYTKGVPKEGAMGIRETSQKIMQRDRESSGHQKVIRRHPVFESDFQKLPSNPNSPDVPNYPISGSGSSPEPKAPQGLALSFLGATLAETEFSFPPDSMGAVGPSQFIVALNGRIRSFNKNTGVKDGGIDANTDVFFSSVMTPPITNNFTSDPHIRYDRLSGRWLVDMIDVPGFTGSLPNRIMIAVSDSSTITPSTVWTFFQFQGDSSFFCDFPSLGVDAHALYMGVNLFSAGRRGTFGGTKAFVVRKTSILGAGPIVVTTFNGLVGKSMGHATGPFAPQGVDNYDPASTEGYIIGVDAGFYGLMQLRRVTDPGGTPSISSDITITIPLNGGAINIPHLGNTAGTVGYLDGGDYRLLNAHFRNGHLWTCENIGVDNTGSPSGTDTRMGVRWYDLNGVPSGQTPSVAQSGTVFQQTGTNSTDQRSYWMGTIMVSGQGHAAMGFSVAGANEHANAGTAGRLVNDPLGTMRTPVLYTASSSSYNPSGDPGSSTGRRWGDFSYTSLDPSDDMTMWTIQEFCNANNSYGLQIVRLLAPPPATPSSCSPASVTNGASGINVLLTGTSDGATGFYDPGAGFSNRISASVSGGGVTVNSVTYTDPTHLTLHLSVAAGASTGSRTVTVTNPDGQSATSSSAILNVIGNVSNNSPPTLAQISDKTNNELTTLIFTNAATDPDGDSLSFNLDTGPPGASLNPTNGVFTWTPTEAQGPGTYDCTISVMDNGSPPMSASKSFKIFVNEVNSSPMLDPIADRTIHAGTTLVITNSATDSDLPTNTLTFSLGGIVPTGASIDQASGIFTWTPDDSYANTINPITVQVTDNGAPPMDDSKSFNVSVFSRPIIESITRSNGVVTITWSAISNETYTVQYKDDLVAPGWNDLLPDVTASGPTATKSNSATPSGERFYRIRLSP